MLLSKTRIALYLVGTFLAVVMVVVAIGALIGNYYLGRAEAKVLDHSREEKVAGSLLRDLDSLDRVGLLAQAARLEDKIEPTRDAGTVLNKILPWYLKSVPSDATLILPNGVREVVESWGSTWPTYMDKAPLSGVDFTWMGKLLAYEYWQMEEPQETAGIGMSDPGFPQDADPSYESLPDLGLLTVWIKLRLASIRQGAQAEPALEEVLQLSALALTTQRMSVIQAGLSWQALAQEAATFSRDSGVTISLPQTFMSMDEIKLARTALPAPMAYIDLSIPAVLAERIFPTGKVRLGTCAALRQRLPALHWEETLLGPSYPDAFAALEPLVVRLAKGCRPSQAWTMWAGRKTEPPLLLAQGGIINRWFMAVPQLRKAFGLTLHEMVRSRDLEPYFSEFEESETL